MGKMLVIKNANFTENQISGGIGISQSFGNSPVLAISQKTLTQKFNETDTSIGNIKEKMPSESITDEDIYGIMTSNEKLDTQF